MYKIRVHVPEISTVDLGKRKLTICARSEVAEPIPLVQLMSLTDWTRDEILNDDSTVKGSLLLTYMTLSDWRKSSECNFYLRNEK